MASPGNLGKQSFNVIEQINDDDDDDDDDDEII